MEALFFYCSLSSRFPNHIILLSELRLWKHDGEGIRSTNGKGGAKRGSDTRSAELDAQRDQQIGKQLAHRT